MRGAYAIEEGKIYKIELNGVRQLLGHTVSEYNKISAAVETAANKAFDLHEEKEKIKKERDEYYEKLIEHGIITKPKTQEEINAELLEMNMQLSKRLSSAIDAIDRLTNNKGDDKGGCKQDIKQTNNDGNGGSAISTK